jgi:hypothetical protein
VVNKEQEADLHTASDSPKFSEGALVYRWRTWNGKLAAVIVDEDSGQIHFQNCHRPKSFWPTQTECSYSCLLKDLKGVHINNYKGGRWLFIVTQTGSAAVSPFSPNFDVFAEKLPTLLAPEQECFNSSDPLLGYIYALGIFAGVLSSLVVIPLTFSLGFTVLIVFLGGAIGFAIPYLFVVMAESRRFSEPPEA